jgi:hypothetical protein
MTEPRSSVDSIRAEIPYLRTELEIVHVEYTSRILGQETLETRTVPVRNGRTAGEPPSLEREGFEIFTSPSRVARERLDELVAQKPLLEMRPVEFDYWDETIPLIQERSGARDVLPLHASAIRCSPAMMRKEMMTPAGWAHLDYDAEEAAVQLQETLEHSGREIEPFRRYVLYQGWRVLSDPPQDYPLAVCDARTVTTADIIPIDYHVSAEEGDDVTYRSQGSRYSDRHRWWYFPDVTIDEMIVFIGFDSARPDSPNTLHVAFEDTTAHDPVPRSSLETRYFALFD